LLCGLGDGFFGGRGGEGELGVGFAHEWVGIMMQFEPSASPHFSHLSAVACGSHALAVSGLILAADGVCSHSPDGRERVCDFPNCEGSLHGVR
jgi:hypothetical protein